MAHGSRVWPGPGVRWTRDERGGQPPRRDCRARRLHRLVSRSAAARGVCSSGDGAAATGGGNRAPRSRASPGGARLSPRMAADRGLSSDGRSQRWPRRRRRDGGHRVDLRHRHPSRHLVSDQSAGRRVLPSLGHADGGSDRPLPGELLRHRLCNPPDGFPAGGNPLRRDAAHPSWPAHSSRGHRRAPAVDCPLAQHHRDREPCAQSARRLAGFVVSQLAYGIVAGIVVSRQERVRTWQGAPLAIRAGLAASGLADPAGEEKKR